MKSFKYSMIVGTGLNSIGCWIRFFAKQNFPLAVSGQIITGLAQAFILPAPVFVADRFFSTAEKFGVITICIQSDYLGNAFGYIFPTWFVQEDYNSVPFLLFLQALLLTIPFLLCLLVIKEKPDKPPNAYFFEENSESFLNQLKQLITPRFLIPMINFSVCFSLSQTVPSVIDYLLEPLNYSPLKMGTIGLVYSASGMITGTLSTIIIAKYQSKLVFKKSIQFLILLSFIALGCFAKFITLPNFLLKNIIVAFAGIGIIGILPFACQYLEEISYPVNENISINSFIFVSAILSLSLTELSTSDFVGEKGVYVLFFIIIIPTIYFLFLFKMNSKVSIKSNLNI